MEKNITKEQKIQMLSEDFLDRDQGTLVKSRITGRLNWESTIRTGGAYSEFILHPDSEEDLIKNACSLASDMLTVMDTPGKVDVRISTDQSCTNASTVWVATKVFDDPDMSVGKKLDTFIGLAVHEGCHLLYTDFGFPSATDGTVVLALENIVEDERIERECGESRPGLSNFLAAAKYFYFDKYRMELRKQGRLESLDTPKRLMNAILSYIRYPKALEVADVSEFCDVLLTVREILTPYPTTTSQSFEAARKIFEAMKEFLKQRPLPQSAAQSKNNGQNDASESGDKSEADASGQRSITQGKPSGKQAKGSSTSVSEIDKSLSQMQHALDALTKSPVDRGLSEDEQSEIVRKEGGRVALVCEGRLERGIQPKTFVERAGEDRDVYEQSLERVRQFVPAIGKSLRCMSEEYKLVQHGMRNGMLDTGKLAEAIQGVPTVYLRDGKVNSDRMVVCLLIDESGSMWGGCEEAARDTAVLLNEALGKIPNIDLYIYGHTASKTTTSLVVYREKSFKKRWTLGCTSSRAGNHDSIAIREAAGRIRRFTKEQCLFFVISDGAPNESPALVKKAVQDITKTGFKIIAVSIDPYYDPATMYENNIVFSDLPSLAINLGKMIKTALMKKIHKMMAD